MADEQTKHDAHGDERLLEAGTGTLAAPQLVLPGEAAAPEPRGIATPHADLSKPSKPSNFDAWTRDRLRRSSLPPAMAERETRARPAVRLASVANDEGDALSLAGRTASAFPYAADLVREMTDRFSLGDFTGALRVAELLLGQDASHDLAQHYARMSREKLEAIYMSRLSAGGTIPALMVPESELRWLGLDSQIGLVLARVDGVSPVDSVIAESGVPRLDALRALVELLASRVIRLV